MERVVLVTIVVLSACYGDAPPPVAAVAPPPPANGFDRVIGELDTIRHRMCTCADDACADKVGDQHEAWTRAHKKLATGGEDTATDAQIGRTVRIEAAYKKCDNRFGLGNAIRKMTEFKDMMCQCADKTCADHVTDQMTKWSMEMAKHVDRDFKVTEEETKQMTKVTEEFTQCAVKAMSAGTGP